MAESRPFLALARGFAVASALGSGFAVAVVIGVLAGRAIDRSLGWRPIAFTVALGFVGGLAGGWTVIRSLRSLERGERFRRDPARNGKRRAEQDEGPGTEA